METDTVGSEEIRIFNILDFIWADLIYLCLYFVLFISLGAGLHRCDVENL